MQDFSSGRAAQPQGTWPPGVQESAQGCDREVEGAETEALCSGLSPLLQRVLIFSLISPSPPTLISSSSDIPADFAWGVVLWDLNLAEEEEQVKSLACPASVAQ